MSKTVKFGLLLITLSTLHVSYKVIEGNVIPIQSNIELLNLLRNKILERSNYYRKIYNYLQFTLNERMTIRAQYWANSLATSTQLKHDPKDSKDYGGNLTKTPPLVNLGERVVDIWYSFAAGIKPNESAAGYYYNKYMATLTQLLWKSTTHIGVGVSQDVYGYYYVVVYYYPAGNIANWYTSNLPSLSKHDVKTGQYLQESFHMRLREKILVYTSRWGNLQLPQEAGKYAIRKGPVEYTAMTVCNGMTKTEDWSIRKQVFDRINNYRNRHGMSRLLINENYNRSAQEYANQMAENKIFNGQNSKNKRCGQNKYKSPPTIFGDFGEVAVDTWYNQIRLLSENMKESEFFGNPEIGCLTQMLWKAATAIGVGVSVDNVGDYYLVVYFFPPGNIENSFLENLPRFTNTQICAGANANDRLNKLAGIEVKFMNPNWNLITVDDESTRT